MLWNSTEKENAIVKQDTLSICSDRELTFLILFLSIVTTQSIATESTAGVF